MCRRGIFGPLEGLGVQLGNLSSVPFRNPDIIVLIGDDAIDRAERGGQRIDSHFLCFSIPPAHGVSRNPPDVNVSFRVDGERLRPFLGELEDIIGIKRVPRLPLFGFRVEHVQVFYLRSVGALMFRKPDHSVLINVEIVDAAFGIRPVFRI